MKVVEITSLGSPLGLRVIQELLPDAGYGVSAGKPANTKAWVNVRDRRDPVAAAGPVDVRWTGVQDEVVANERSAHSVERYLSKAKVGAAIRAALPELAP